MASRQRGNRIPVLTCEQCRAVDRYAIEALGVPGVVLMENAGRSAADLIDHWARGRARRRPGGPGDPPPPPHAAIVCGKGNNGGDGLVIARHLANRGWGVSVDLTADPASLTGDAAVNHRIAAGMELAIRVLDGPAALAAAAQRWRTATVVVDALLGTGFAGTVRDPLAGIIDAINAAAQAPGTGPLIVAIDVPSGLDADTGRADGPAVRVHRTVTFLAMKVGYTKKTARAYLGRVTVADIGVPLELILTRLGLPGAARATSRGPTAGL
ncbi:MAG: NAD(P)H-hydrate epimerase [Planctomycetes bacterium]|nr:NAD(P)H-hydrate epimerase [Planctomycetota bacterium]